MNADVLIVDDDYAMRQILQSICELTNVPFRTANDGIEALAMVEQRLPGMIILDLSMPRLDGYGVLERLRASSRTCELPVMIYTAHHLRPDDKARLGLPDSMIVIKNEMNIEQLQQIITSYCLSCC